NTSQSSNTCRSPSNRMSQADGGTRTASICGAYVALHDALSRLVTSGSIKQLPLHSLCAAVSVGIHSGTPIIDLPYVEDSTAEVDMNVVMLAPLSGGTARFVEVQGTAEGQAFTREQLDVLLALAEGGLAQVFDHQRSIIAVPPPPRA
ncbi:MAG: hypothetical protein ACKOE7_13255, partial [Actinomycetota bacterium]